MALNNQDIARRLREHANQLARAGGNLYRIRAFRSAAIAVMGLSGDVIELVAGGGPRELERVPGIGKSLAITIADYVAALAGNGAAA